MEKATAPEDTLWNTVDVNQNIVKLLSHRETNVENARRLKESCHFAPSQLKQLTLEKTLEGHQGCVNCLEWSSNGRLLASGSDDTHVRIWDPFLNKCLTVVPTKHIGNIFSVKFLGDGNLIATCAGDCKVKVQPVADKQRSAYVDCSCHHNRVKRLATAPEQPSVFWSAGEDGLIIQYDLREQHDCSKNSVAFLNMTALAEFKCIAVNPTKPHLIAVGASDCYVRLYDRRFVKLTSPKINIDGNVFKAPECVQYYAPGNLARENATSEFSFKLVATYVTFDPSGNDLLVNLGGDHIYLYNINNSRFCEELIVPQCLGVSGGSKRNMAYKSCCSEDQKSATYNDHRHNYKFPEGGPCVCQCLQRARRIQKRQWLGDVYFAAREYFTVIEQFPECRDAYLHLIECLTQLQWSSEAKNWIDYYERQFPTFASDKRFDGLKEDWKKMPPILNDKEESAKGSMDDEEKQLRLGSRDYGERYLGHCNTTTDIKEANFLGRDASFICAGSDDGMIYIWDRKTTNLLTALVGDVSIVNCVQPHPSICYLASSGIDHGVKIWSPSSDKCLEDPQRTAYVVKDLWQAIEFNQERMSNMNNMDPFDTILMNMGFRELRSASHGVPQPSCRTS